MRINEIASAEDQMALWRLVSDSVWQAIETQRQQQAQAEQDNMIQQRMAALEADNIDRQIEGRLQETQMKNEGSLERTMATSRTHLANAKIKGIYDMEKEKMKPKPPTSKPKK